MRKQHRRLGALAVAATLFAASAAHAQQVIYEQNFNTTPILPYAFTYAYSGYGYDPVASDETYQQIDVNGSTFATQVESTTGNGVGGSNAYSVVGDFSGVIPGATAALPAGAGLIYTYQGFGLGVGVLNAPGLPSANLADYTIRFDLVFAGLNGTEAPAEIQFALAVPDDTFRTDGDTDVDPFAVYKAFVTANSNYATYTVNLANLTPDFNNSSAPADQRDFAANVHRLLVQQFQLNIDGGPFGGDANNRVSLDNLQITAVPEPTSAALLGLSLLALAPRRRRRA